MSCFENEQDRVCDGCAVKSTVRCPYGDDIPPDLAFGCYHYVKLPVVSNKTGKETRCMTCRFLFHKAREVQGDRSFIMCGWIPSVTQKIKPVPNCPHYKQLRKKQVLKRADRKKKR